MFSYCSHDNKALNLECSSKMHSEGKTTAGGTLGHWAGVRLVSFNIILHSDRLYFNLFWFTLWRSLWKLLLTALTQKLSQLLAGSKSNSFPRLYWPLTLSFCFGFADCDEARPWLPDRSHLVVRPLPLPPCRYSTQVSVLLIFFVFIDNIPSRHTFSGPRLHPPTKPRAARVPLLPCLRGHKRNFSTYLTFHGNKHPLIRHNESQQFSLHGAWHALPHLSRDMPHWRLRGRTEQGDDRLDFSLSRHMLCLVRKMMSE